MFAEKFWSKDRFPVVYENDQAKAVMVDVESFDKIELILDNLMNRDTEKEDNLLAASELLNKLVSEAKKESPTDNWRTAIDEL